MIAPSLPRLALAVLLVSAACSTSGIRVAPPAPETLRTKELPYTADVFLIVDVVSVKPRTPEIEATIEKRRQLLTSPSAKTSYNADIVQVIPRKYLIPNGSRISNPQRAIGEYRFDPQAMAKGEEGLRELLNEKMEMLVDYDGDERPTPGHRGVVNVTTIPGMSYYGAPSTTVVSWVGKEWLPKLFTLTYDAAYPNDVAVPTN